MNAAPSLQVVPRVLAGSTPFTTDLRARQKQASLAAKQQRESGVRRKVNPATCERDYSEAELEFMTAIERYKLSSGRKFPTWSEVLEVVRALGYQKLAENAANLAG